MFLEEHMALLLVLHAISAGATVMLSTHLVFWLRPILRGRYGKYRATRRFALLSAGAYLLTLCLGLVLYPTFKVRVRAEYLENPSAITRATEARYEAAHQAAKRNEESRHYRTGEAVTSDALPAKASADVISIDASHRVGKGAKIVRWFDVKEHWAGFGAIVASALALILLSWKPSKDNAVIGKVVFTLALASATSAWASAIIGLLTTAARSVASY